MATATLVTHCGAVKVSREALATLPAPVALGSRHRPIHPRDLVEALTAEASARGYLLRKEQYAIQREGELLFGTLDFLRPEDSGDGETGVALGFRSASDQSHALQVCAGRRVFVCDNLALSGDLLALRRKHTTGMVLAQEMVRAFDRFVEHSERLLASIGVLRAREIAPAEARETIYEALVRKVIPLRLFEGVHHAYFDVDPEARPDCAPRTAWGLHNAFTRVISGLSPAASWRANTALGRLFGLRSAEDKEVTH